jgi:hypothetical protein
MAGPPGVLFAHKWASGASAGFGHIGGTAGVALTGKTSDDAQALAALRDALGPFGACHPRGLAEAAILLCASPQWAVWLPADRGV